jgi:hypothetical protein
VQGVPPAEQAAKLNHVSHLGEGRHAQRPRAQLLRSVFGELVEQGVEHSTSLGTEALQELFVLTLHAQRPLGAGDQRQLPGRVDQQIEGVGLGVAELGHQVVGFDGPAL